MVRASRMAQDEGALQVYRFDKDLGRPTAILAITILGHIVLKKLMKDSWIWADSTFVFVMSLAGNVIAEKLVTKPVTRHLSESPSEHRFRGYWPRWSAVYVLALFAIFSLSIDQVLLDAFGSFSTQLQHGENLTSE